MRLPGQPPVQPVPGSPAAGVRPHILARRKRRIRPRIPAPGVRRLDHRPAIDRRNRVVAGLRKTPQHRLKRPPLHAVVACAGRERRQGVLRALRILEQVRRIAASIHGRAAELRQPDRLHPGDPVCRRRASHPVGPVVMRVRPPALQVLDPEHPVLAMRRVRDQSPGLRRPVRVRSIEPVESLAPRDLRRQIGRFIRPDERLAIHAPVARPPVAQRRVPVDPDVVDLRIGPQRIEVEHHLSSASRPRILRPVGRIADRHARPDHRPAFSRQRLQLCNRRKPAARIPRGRQPPHLRADQQPLRTDLRRQRRIVQRQPPQAPAVRRPEHRRDPGRSPGAVLAPHPSAPGIGRLFRPSIRVRQAVPRGHVHQDEGVQSHLQSPRLQRSHRLSHALIRRGPAIRGAAPAPRDQMRLSPFQPCH